MAFDERHPQYTNSSRVYAGVGTEKQTDGVRRTPSDSEILPRVYAGTGDERSASELMSARGDVSEAGRKFDWDPVAESPLEPVTEEEERASVQIQSRSQNH